ncbi:hypothetical protein L0337_07260 [candidate division KSB1 bacterium]|nr:hypothetical protein [candidate division KSB1 bacterium]
MLIFRHGVQISAMQFPFASQDAAWRIRFERRIENEKLLDLAYQRRKAAGGRKLQPPQEAQKRPANRVSG